MKKRTVHDYTNPACTRVRTESTIRPIHRLPSPASSPPAGDRSASAAATSAGAPAPPAPGSAPACCARFPRIQQSLGPSHRPHAHDAGSLLPIAPTLASLAPRLRLGGRFQIGIADISAESIADLSSEAAADLARNQQADALLVALAPARAQRCPRSFTIGRYCLATSSDIGNPGRARLRCADRELIFMEIGRGYRFTGVLRTNIVLESWRPMRAKRAVWPNFFFALPAFAPMQCQFDLVHGPVRVSRFGPQ